MGGRERAAASTVRHRAGCVRVLRFAGGCRSRFFVRAVRVLLVLHGCAATDDVRYGPADELCSLFSLGGTLAAGGCLFACVPVYLCSHLHLVACVGLDADAPLLAAFLAPASSAFLLLSNILSLCVMF